MSKCQMFTIRGRLPSLNEYVDAERGSRYAGANIKKETDRRICDAIKAARLQRVDYPVDIEITWYEPNRRRDWDNVVFAAKFILDALQHEDIIRGDSQRYVPEPILNIGKHDSEDPRVEVRLRYSRLYSEDKVRGV